jgi:hypothetical protein
MPQFTKEEYKFIGLYVLTHLGTLNFAESGDSTKITDPQLLLELRDILQTQYQDGITAIPEAYLNADDSFSGIFEDEVSPKLIKRFKFAIAPNDEISYKLLNAADVENFAEELEFATATTKKKKNCTKGVSCGIGCISTLKTCRKTPDALTKKKTAELRKKVAPSKELSSAPAKKETPKTFPDDLESLETVKTLSSASGSVVRSPDGKLYVMRKASNEELRAESASDEVYRVLGINTPKYKIYDTPDGPVKLIEYVEGRSFKKVTTKGTSAEKKKLMEELQKQYLADVLLGNQSPLDNVVLGNDGKVYRVSNTEALNKSLSKHPVELWSMKNSIFAPSTHKDIVSQIDAIAAKQKQILASVPPDVRSTLKERLEEMQRIAQISKTLESDNWNDDYISTFTKHVVGIRAAGITNRLPLKMTSDPDNITILKDENGREFDHLRGEGSIMKDFEKYTAKSGGDYSITTDYLERQAGSSWSNAAQAYKYHLASQRNSVPNDDFFWMNGEKKAKQAYNSYIKQFGGKEKYTQSMAAYHAFNYEILAKTDLPNKNPDGTVTLLRTESEEVMKKNGLKPGDENVTMKRGVAESTSLVQEVSVFGSELTEQRVPIHRIVASYLHERYPEDGGSALMGDQENELVAILDKVPFKYRKLDKDAKMKLQAVDDGQALLDAFFAS